MSWTDLKVGESRDGWRRVTKEEFNAFLDAYPRAALVHDCCGISEPPLHSWNDFSNGKVWPESMIAKAQLYETDKVDECYGTSYGDRFYLYDSIVFRGSEHYISGMKTSPGVWSLWRPIRPFSRTPVPGHGLQEGDVIESEHIKLEVFEVGSHYVLAREMEE